jgi:hypothetical protein
MHFYVENQAEEKFKMRKFSLLLLYAHTLKEFLFLLSDSNNFASKKYAIFASNTRNMQAQTAQG